MAKRPKKRQRHPLFDLQSARANVLHASQLGFWTNEEAAAYSMGFDPKFLNAAAAQSHLAESDEAKEFRRRIKVIERAISVGDLAVPLRPARFLDWANACKLEVPTELISAMVPSTTSAQTSDTRVRELEEKASVLEQKCEEYRRRLDEPHPRRLTSYQKIVLGLGIEDFGYIPGSARNAAAGKISERIGQGRLRTSVDTVRSCLREAAEDLGVDVATLANDEDEIPTS